MKIYSYLFVAIGQDDVSIYTDQINALVNDFHENGPGSVGENLDLGLQMLEVRLKIRSLRIDYTTIMYNNVIITCQ